MSAKDKWVWMPHPAHFICARDCKFHLATVVGDYIVSTVGEMVPDAPIREIFAETRGKSLVGRGDARLADYMEKIGYEDIGYQRKYETMVFKASAREPNPETDCCPYVIDASEELAMRGYNDAASAYRGHLALCDEWANK